MKKTALLIPFINTNTKEEGYIWETPSENPLSKNFVNLEDALNNKPDQTLYVCKDDSYNLI